MHSRLYNHIKNLLLPCIGFSVATGFLSAIVITVFKILTELVIHLSANIYGSVKSNPIWIPALIIGAAAIGLVSSFILSISHSCRGGGIPTSVAAIRGIVSFNWIKSIFLLPFSALLTFFCGLPLGTEGPCVQMGTAIGDGVVQCLGSEKNKNWRRYIMTGGASAGFSIATASPITAILFSMEELHKRFSPLLITVSSISIITAQVTMQILASFGIGTLKLFNIPEVATISPKFLFAPLLIGLVCGGCAILFNRFYNVINKIIHSALKKVSIKIVFPVLFASVAALGLLLFDALGTGHGLSESLLLGRSKWYILLIILIVRMIIMMISNTAGVTGGVFLPTLAIGAIIASLCADAMIAFGWIEPYHYTLIVALGIAAFWGATSHVPITACVFAIEAMVGINNILSVIIATTVAFLIVGLSNVEDFTDTVIESRIRAISKGKNPTVIEVPLTVVQDAFVSGKELRDILWPNSCRIVSVDRAPANRGKAEIDTGDVITVHYKTYDPEETAKELTSMVGKQAPEIEAMMNPQH